MKALLIVSSLFLSSTLGEVISNTYSSYVQTPHAVTKLARNDAGFAYTVTSDHNQPINLLYGVQPIVTPLALAYSSLSSAPFNYIAQNVLPYDIYKHVIPKFVIPYSAFAVSPLASHVSSIHQTSTIPAKIDEEKKSDDAKMPVSMDGPIVPVHGDQSTVILQNPFLANFFDQNRLVQQVPAENPTVVSSVAADVPSAQESDMKGHETVGVESA